MWRLADTEMATKTFINSNYLNQELQKMETAFFFDNGMLPLLSLKIIKSAAQRFLHVP
jgi:hypothetical protein